MNAEHNTGCPKNSDMGVKNKWTGIPGYEMVFREQVGPQKWEPIVPYISFSLDGKEFYAQGVDARALAAAIDTGEAITIINQGAEGDPFLNNADHRFIDGLEEVAPNVFVTVLGS